MKILIVGGGGREHALAWKAAQSSRVDVVYVAPGNAGTAADGKLENIPVGAEDITALKEFALNAKIELAIIGPEAPLVAGIVDQFNDAGLACFGPTAAAAMLEGSKSFTKDFLKKYRIPTAEYEVFTATEPAIEYVQTRSTPIVIKADGLAAGKGVVIAQSETDAINIINDMLSGNKFGAAGHRVVIEDYLDGEEASFIVITDGEHVLPLASSQDHKARDAGDTGPNTGGMGAYSPAPIVDDAVYERIMHDIIMPTVRGMDKEGRTYRGFLYAGIMLGGDGIPRVLEFNCRLGDPETQPIMMRLQSDLVSLCLAALDKKLDRYSTEWDKRAALGVVAAARGYPESASKGDVITGLDRNFADNIKVFHAGTGKENDLIVTSGGRVLCVTGMGASVTEARRNVYRAIKQIEYDGMFYRKDIGYRAIEREAR